MTTATAPMSNATAVSQPPARSFNPHMRHKEFGPVEIISAGGTTHYSCRLRTEDGQVVVADNRGLRTL